MTNPTGLQKMLDQARAEDRLVVLATGVFDVLHQEHIGFLKDAQQEAAGGVLIVGVESDTRVTKLKGEGRPVYSETERVKQLMKTGIPDLVFVLPELFSQHQQHRQLIHRIGPDILAVSSHTPHLDAKRRLMREIGGKVVVVRQQNPDISTTQILKQQGIS